jgi:hypothetical protein
MLIQLMMTLNSHNEMHLLRRREGKHEDFKDEDALVSAEITTLC